jgi:hypothetical protein
VEARAFAAPARVEPSVRAAAALGDALEAVGHAALLRWRSRPAHRAPLTAPGFTDPPPPPPMTRRPRRGAAIRPAPAGVRALEGDCAPAAKNATTRSYFA